MTGVARAVTLFFTERRFVNQQIGALRGIDGRGTGARVARERDEASRSGVADKAFSRQPSAISKLDGLTFRKLSPEWPLGNAGRFGFLDVEATAPHMLFQYVAERRAAAVFRGKRADVVPITFPNGISRLYLCDFDGKGNSFDAQLHGGTQDLLCALRSVERQRLGASLQPQRANQADDTEEVISMKVSEEDFGEREAHAVAHHLALGAFAALEQQRLALAVNSEATDVSFDGRPGRGGAQEGYGEHG